MFTNNFGEYKNISCGLVSSSMIDGTHHEVYPIPLLSVYVAALVIHAVAQVEITQNYVNKEEQPIEAIYYFPIDPDGAVTNFRVELDDRMIKGVVKPREEAQETYDKAVASRTTSFLGEETKADMFKLRVGSLQPGARVKVIIEYVTEVKNEPGTNNIRFYIPTTIAPRYVSAEETDTRATDIRNMKFSPSSPATLSLKVEVSVQGGIKSIQSPTHNVTVDIPETTTVTENDEWGMNATVELSGQTTDMDRDFVIIIEPQEKHKPRLYSENSDIGNGSTAVMIHLLPSFQLKEQKTELIFVLDRSASMTGQSIRSAKEALTLFLHSMPVDCYFNVLGFGSRYEFLFPASVKYDDESLRKAQKHATELNADLGGTEIFEPLKALYETPPIDGYSKQFFILTDGEVSNTDRVLAIVKANAHKVRVFTLGIGAAASHYLVEGVATAGGGTAVFVDYNESMDKKVINQLKNALQPSLFNVTIKWNESATDDAPERQVSDLVMNTNKTLFGYNKPIVSETTASVSLPSVIRQSPKKVRPIYDGSQLLVLGISENGLPKSVLITAHTPDGPLTVRIEHSTSNNLDGNGNLLHRLAAIKLIRELEMEVSSLHDENSDAGKILKNEIINIGCQNGIASRYTSFVASDVRNDKQSEENWVMVTRHVPSQIAQGWHGRNRMGGVRQLAGSFPSSSHGCGPYGCNAGSLFRSIVANPNQHSSFDHQTSLYNYPSPSYDYQSPLYDYKGYSGKAAAASDGIVTFGSHSGSGVDGSYTSHGQNVGGGSYSSHRESSADVSFNSLSRSGVWGSSDSYGGSGVGGSFNSYGDSGLGGSFNSYGGIPDSSADNGRSSSTLMQLINLQSYDGSFTLNEALSQILGKTLQELKAACVTHNLSEQKFATALAVGFFRTKLADEKDRWELVVSKAQQWLSSAVQPENVNTVTKLASDFLK